MITLTHINSSNCLLSIYMGTDVFLSNAAQRKCQQQAWFYKAMCPDLWMPQVRAEPAAQQGAADWLHHQPLTPPLQWSTQSWLDITITGCTLLSIHLLYPGGQKYTICFGTQNCLVMSWFGDTSIPLWMAAVPASLVSLFPSRGL